MVRVFIAVTIPEDIKSYVIGVQKQLESLPIKVKFVEPGNLHISLSFLDDIGTNEVETTKSELDKIVSSYSKFEIVLGDILLIPNENSTRVIALGVNNDVPESIRKEIVKTIGGKSHPAHLTLARVNVIDDKRRFLEGIKKIAVNKTQVNVDNICLVESVLTKSGPVYTVLHKSYLK